MKKRKKKKGFTLIELVVVVAIIATLATVAVPKFGKIQEDATLKSDLANSKIIANVASTLLTDNDLQDEMIIDKDVDNKIEEYLQNPPKPRSKGYSNYVVRIDGDSIEVSMIGNDKETQRLFPEIDE